MSAAEDAAWAAAIDHWLDPDGTALADAVEAWAADQPYTREAEGYPRGLLLNETWWDIYDRFQEHARRQEARAGAFPGMRRATAHLRGHVW